MYKRKHILKGLRKNLVEMKKMRIECTQFEMLATNSSHEFMSQNQRFKQQLFTKIGKDFNCHNSMLGLYCKRRGGFSNRHLVTYTNFRVWSLPNSSLLHKIST